MPIHPYENSPCKVGDPAPVGVWIVVHSGAIYKVSREATTCLNTDFTGWWWATEPFEWVSNDPQKGKRYYAAWRPRHPDDKNLEVLIYPPEVVEVYGGPFVNGAPTATFIKYHDILSGGA